MINSCSNSSSDVYNLLSFPCDKLDIILRIKTELRFLGRSIYSGGTLRTVIVINRVRITSDLSCTSL